jgi:hypothetical protein
MRLFYDIDDPMTVGGGPTVGTPTTGGPVKPTPNLPAAGNTPPSSPSMPTIIPKPNYNDPKSRGQYAEKFYNQYPKIGHGYGDTPLRVNEIPETDWDKETPKQMVTAAVDKLGIDPALLYTSAMHEGMSGLWGDKDNNIVTSGNDKFQVSGYNSFGLDTFSDAFPGLVKKGYLPADFQNNFIKRVIPPQEGDNKTAVNSADFKDTKSALMAKAAMMKMEYDDIDSYAKQRKITLSPKARDFFALVDYNGGEGTGHQMLNDYYNNGQLEGDKFLQARPTIGKGLKADSYQKVYQNVAQRLEMTRALKEQGLF